MGNHLIGPAKGLIVFVTSVLVAKSSVFALNCTGSRTSPVYSFPSLGGHWLCVAQSTYAPAARVSLEAMQVQQGWEELAGRKGQSIERREWRTRSEDEKEALQEKNKGNVMMTEVSD